MTLSDIAERAKTSTEQEARSRVTWAQLQELAGQFNEAKKTLFSKPRAFTGDIEHDLESEAAVTAYNKAQDAYQSAMRKYQDQQKLPTANLAGERG